MLGIPWEKNAVDEKISIKVCKRQGSDKKKEIGKGRWTEGITRNDFEKLQETKGQWESWYN